MKTNMKFTLNGYASEIIFRKRLAGFSLRDEVKYVVIIDRKVRELFDRELHFLLHNKPVYIFEAEEQNKNPAESVKIFRFLQKNNVNRSTLIVGIGGGVTTDIVSFCASTYMRGCRLCLIPTTFLAMIDAGIGGKTSLNVDKIKNNIGTFYPAEKIYIFPEFLNTLSEKELKNGWAECIKIALIRNEFLSKQLLEDDLITEELLKFAIGTKMRICRRDLKDRNERRILNLGHSFGHIIEASCDYKIPHGYAVAVGIRIATELSYELNFLNIKYLNKINSLLDSFGLPQELSLSVSLSKIKFINLLRKDKKSNENINLILLKNRFQPFIHKLQNPDSAWRIFRKYTMKKR